MNVSWLELERYHMNELPAAARSRVETALQTSPVLRERLRSIEGDARPMPPLMFPAKRRALVLRFRGSTVALAAAACLAVFVATRGEDERPSRMTVKGGEMALTIVREREGNVATDLSHSTDSDRFKALVTCPPGESGYRFIVFQGNHVSEVLNATTLRCANNVPLAGAFRVTGVDSALACFTRSATPVKQIGTLPKESVCVRVGKPE